MDGTLIDSEPYWIVAEQELVSSFGGTWPVDDGMDLVGQGLEVSARAMKSRGVDLPIAQIIDRLTSRVLEQAVEHLPWRPGALELLLAIRNAGIPTALVTMSMRPLAEHIASAMENPLFDVIVTGGDVDNAKPHPEPYERAARLLGVEITSCVALEDSIPGLASAASAGAVTIGIPAHVVLPEKPKYTLWPTLEGRTVEDLVHHFHTQTSQRSLQEDTV